ncbi:MAG: 3-hydroxyacyl-CoA dehydrogenase [Gemmobacter sp.]
MQDLTRNDLVIGVVGAGAMGAGIAQIAAAAGRRVVLHDAREGAAAEARSAILKRIDRRVAEGKATVADRETMAANLSVATGLEGLAPCGLTVEAIVENLEIKRKVFAALADIVAPDAVLASNTSSLPIGALAAGMPGPERFAGLHFFNPVPVMKLVEVIPGPDTLLGVLDGLIALSRALGKVPVAVRDTPGFLVNFGGRAYTTEALAILHEAVATPAQIDAVMRDCWGFRMGPLELMDLTGIDVNFPVTRFVHETHFADPRLRSTPLHRYLLEVGRLGRKAGRGFYDYGEGAAVASADAEPTAPPAVAVSLAEPDEPLAAFLAGCGITVLHHDDGRVPLLAAPEGEDCSALAARTGTDHRRLVALDLTGDTSRRVTIMTAPAADPAVRAAVVAALAPQRAVTVIADSPGFIGQRIAAMVANLGCEMAQTQLAKPGDIDTAMRLGLNYPRGPLELADAMGPATVLRILTRIQALTGDDRYRPSGWLRRRAQLGMSALEL